MPDEPTVVDPEKPVVEEKPTVVPLTREELNETLAQRDDALLRAVREGQQTLFDAMNRTREPTREPAKAVDEPVVSNEDFWKDPNAAMKQFFEKKIAPLAAQRPQQDVTGLMALVETQKLQLRQKVGEAEWKKMEPAITQVFAKTDPRVLSDPGGMDAVWRLTKSYMVEAEDNEKAKREQRNMRGSLDGSGGAGGGPEVKKTELSADEAFHANALGIAPEAYKKFEKPEEIEIGSGRKARLAAGKK